MTSQILSTYSNKICFFDIVPARYQVLNTVMPEERE